MGCVVNSIIKHNSDPFKINYKYICDQARKALFKVKSDLKHVGTLPPVIMMYIFNAVVRPILTYGSDVWGVNKMGMEEVDKFFMQFLKRTLGVKQSTSSIIVIGETGQIPPSTDCMCNVVKFLNRLEYMDNNVLVRKVYNELCFLEKCGFKTWYSKAWELVFKYKLKPKSNLDAFKLESKYNIKNAFIKKWLYDVKDIQSNPILKTYSIFKQDFGLETYLEKVTNSKYRHALIKLRTSSHDLNIELGRHKDRHDIQKRLCHRCHVIEDENHFLNVCPLYKIERKNLYDIYGINDNTVQTNDDILMRLMNSKYQHHLEALAKYTHTCFNIRREAVNS